MEDLSDAYDNIGYIPDGATWPQRWAEAAESFRERKAVEGRMRPGLMYGHGPREAMDLFLPRGIPEGLVIFVHGGYWMKFDRSYWSHLAEGALARHWAVAMPSYDLCPRVRIADITRQIARAVTAAAHEVPGPIRLAGHSAGGHLVARMLEPGMLPEEVAARIENVLSISPVSDLRPLMQTGLNAELNIDAEEAKAESPVNMAAPKVPVTVWVGADERPAFLDQARWLAEAWGCGHVVDEGRHHFDVVDALADGESAMIKRLIG
ncbi:alpha/beta hydrolase [Salipiger mucosus]|uniref:Esterase/lipase n=1 Tax=Salipiger mucosus DSM 16094 TaxID=1123237 RepID=S9QTZ5_9RHOB|nr:alpha/beta hydrolase [Salipiger mucosus]EPX83077.1 Esterase/lipase [Salipiger mucosus DSM 16094]